MRTRHAVRLALVALLLPLAPARGEEEPADLVGFSGQVRGAVVEKGDRFFTFRVARLLQVWKDSEAADPESIVGRTVKVGPRWEKVGERWQPVVRHAAFIGKLRAGEEITLELRYSEAGRFALLELSEEQRRRAAEEPAPAATPQERPPALPEGVAGFVGRVRGRVVERLDGDLVRFEIEKVTRVWKGNRATNLEAMERLRIRIGPAWIEEKDGRHRPNENHARFLRTLSPGATLDIEVRHGERDYFPVLELTAEQRRAAEAADVPPDSPRDLR